ncbi:hypothetical protein Q428_00285 [Fervidicella metallireducens AeB]|uniref:DUF5673 domain-containing protein n=1 Tax=Fervidicella metallireducens AeB TaxID=1403537 RepID=A0A017RYV8_9CLOT|nr:hypothetical protein [Fervidicella metallireducens]EYE89867.1 hypothetical protein Q428_00285 [Fervidicella metallireducens AeB]
MDIVKTIITSMNISCMLLFISLIFYKLILSVKMGHVIDRVETRKVGLTKYLGYVILSLNFLYLLDKYLGNQITLYEISFFLNLFLFSIYLLIIGKTKLHIKKRGMVCSINHWKWNDIVKYQWKKNMLRLKIKKKKGYRYVKIPICPEEKDRLDLLLQRHINLKIS